MAEPCVSPVAPEAGATGLCCRPGSRSGKALLRAHDPRAWRWGQACGLYHPSLTTRFRGPVSLHEKTGGGAGGRLRALGVPCQRAPISSPVFQNARGCPSAGVSLGC